MVLLTDVAPVRERVHWQSVLEELDDVVLLLDSRYVVTYASPSVRARLGYPPQALAGQALGDLAHPDDLRDALRSLIEMRLGDAVRHTMRLRRADVGYLLLECSLTKVADERAGEIIVLSGRAGGARVALEERLASAELRYRTLLGALSEAVVLLDAQLRIEEVNDEAAVLLGASRHDLLGRRWFEGLDVNDEDGQRLTPASAPVAALLAGPTAREDWHGVLRADGQRALVRCRWTPVADGAQGPHGYVLTMQDARTFRTAGGASVPQQRRLARTAAGLTSREHEVLERLAHGQDAVEIARELELSVYSVRGHIKSLLRKLRVHSQLQAVVVAARRGIVDVAAASGARD
jgi:PAS domain S-box-containing protein